MELSKAAKKIMQQRQADRKASQEPLQAGGPAPTPNDMDRQKAQSTIQFDGRTGRATTLLTNIVPDHSQPRKAENIDQAEILQLADSIKAGEQIQPIVVDWWPELQKWKIVVGARRWLAVQAAGLDRIACVFKMEKMEPVARKLLQGIENIHRANLTDLERAEYFKDLLEMTGWNQTQLAKEMNVSQATVSKALALLEETEQLFTVNNSPEGTSRDDVAKEIKQRKRGKKKRRAAPKEEDALTIKLPIEDDFGHQHTIEITSPHAITEAEAARVLRLAAELLDEQQGQGKAA